MTKEIWLNLPVKDINKSKEFFIKLGFSFNMKHGESDDSACLIVGKTNFAVMLFTENMFKGFTKNGLPDTHKTTEVLISIDAESRAEVEEMAEKVVEAGGIIFSEPEEIQGWMYGCGFADLDGHRWNILFMDMSQMPQ